MNELRVSDIFDLDPFEASLRSFMRPWRFDFPDKTPEIRLEVSEADGTYSVRAEIPGVRKEDIDVRIDGNQVTIGAEFKKDKEEKAGSRVLRCERQYGFASRTFTLADPIDDAKADAKYQDGVLHLMLPKRAQAEQKRLTIA
jgi:HSP20 family protein